MLFRLSGKVNASGDLCLGGPAEGAANPKLGPPPKLQNMRQLFDRDTATLLLPAYVGRQRGTAVNVELKDQRRGFINLSSIANLNWEVELHRIGLLVHEPYANLWSRYGYTALLALHGRGAIHPRFPLWAASRRSSNHLAI